MKNKAGERLVSKATESTKEILTGKEGHGGGGWERKVRRDGIRHA